MPYDDAIAAARAVVADLFPAPLWVWLTGSVITEARTLGSDLDIIVILDRADCPRPYRSSLVRHGFPVELFVNHPAGLLEYLARDLARGRPTLQRMVATAIVIEGDRHPADRLSARARAILAAGPPALTDEERNWARYKLTDGLDDLEHATDPTEIAAVQAQVWHQTAELFLELNRHWVSGGKWLARELIDADPIFAADWLEGRTNPIPCARRVLAMAGGPLFDGFTQLGPPTA